MCDKLDTGMFNNNIDTAVYYGISISVADPHQFYADTDPTYYFLWCWSRSSFSSKWWESVTNCLQTLHGSILSIYASVESLYGPPLGWISSLSFDFDAYPDHAFDFDADPIHSNADPDPTSHRMRFHADPDPQHWFLNPLPSIPPIPTLPHPSERFIMQLDPPDKFKIGTN